MFISHHLDVVGFAHRDRLLAEAEEFRLARSLRAGRRRRRRDAARPPADTFVRAAAEPEPVRPSRNDDANRRSPVRA
jgi:hypothetical protein